MDTDLAALMQEPAGGDNHGRRASTDTDKGSRLPLDATSWQATEFLKEGGWGIARTNDPRPAGMTAHRGVLHPDEYVNPHVLQPALEEGLGFTWEEFQRVSRPGRPRNGDAALSARINRRLHDIRAAGGNLTALASLLFVTQQALSKRADSGNPHA